MKKSTLKKCEELLKKEQIDLRIFIARSTQELKDQEEQNFLDDNDIAANNSQVDLLKRILSEKALRLKMVDSALLRIKKGVYGICIDTEEDIDEDRLLANPTALRSLEAQEMWEKSEKERKMIRPKVQDSKED